MKPKITKLFKQLKFTKEVIAEEKHISSFVFPLSMMVPRKILKKSKLI